MSDRRVWFFLVFAVACFALVPVAPPEYRWVAEVTGVVYVVLAGLVALDNFSRRDDR